MTCPPCTNDCNQGRLCHVTRRTLLDRLRIWWLEWRIDDARREIAYWQLAGVPHDKMRNLREYEEQLVCDLARLT